VPHGVVLEEARNVAQDLGLPAWWLNEQASVYISGKDDPGRRRVFDHPGLRVTAASPRHIFAMKALAARIRDVDDLRVLAGIIEVDSAETALRNRSLPGLPPSSRNSSADPGMPAGVRAGSCRASCSVTSRVPAGPATWNAQGAVSRRAAAWRTWRKMCASASLISGDPGLRSTIIAFSSS
jgi:hypothetical protein